MSSASQNNKGKRSAIKTIKGMLKDKIPAKLDWRKMKLSYLIKKHSL